MKPILRAAAIRRLEQHYLAAQPATGATGAPSLMERAGLAAADLAATLLPLSGAPVLVLAGPGNNGGDAYVCARHLRARGHRVTLVSTAPDAPMPRDANLARAMWRREGGGEVLPAIPASQDYALAVDGLLGIGLMRPVDGVMALWIDSINRLPCPVLALDVPSGIDADSGRAWGRAVRATHTITFLADKPGLHMQDGSDHAGEVHCASLGLDADAGAAGEGAFIDHAGFAAALQTRRQASHKGSHGSAAIVGGAAGMAGAALLAGRAALHLGAGRVYVGMLDTLAVDPLQPELMLRPAAAALEHATATGIGPGLGQDAAALAILRRAIDAGRPLALDADALNLVAAHPVLVTHIARRAHGTVMTPHPAEAARLLGIETDAVQADRIGSALQLAQRFNAAVVLKGNGSVVALADGRWFVNANGNPALATGGTGDILLGFVTALLAAGNLAATALLAAVHLHGAAADAWAAENGGNIGMAAGELLLPARRLWNAWVAAASKSAPPEA